MISSHAQDLIQKFLDRMMSPKEREDLNRLLVENEEVAAAFAEATRTASFLETSLREISAGPAVAPRRTARWRARGFSGQASPTRFLLAASALFGVFVVLVMASLSQERPPVARRTADPQPAPVRRAPEPVPVRKPVKIVSPDRKPVERETPKAVDNARTRVRPRPQPAPSPPEAKPAPAPIPDPPNPEKPVPPPAPGKTRPAPRTAVVVAVVKSVEGVLGLGDGDKATPAQSGDILREGHRLETHGAEARAVIAFEDGTEVELGADTEVRFPDQKSGKRVTLLQGSVRSEVARQPRNRPMVFETAHARAVVLGTTLRLRVEAGAPTFTRLAVMEGRVRLVRTVDSKSVEVPSGHYALAAAVASPELQAFPFARLLGAVAHGRVRAVAFSPDGESVASAGGDGAIRLWSVATRKEIASLASHARDATSLDFSVRGGMLASGSYDDTARIWAVRTRRSVARITAITSSYEDVRFSPNGRLLATANSDGVVRLWEAATGKFLDMFPGHPGGAEALAFSPDGRLLASGGRDRTARLWDLGARKERASLEGHAGNVNGVAFLPDGGKLATGSGDGTIRFWDVASGRAVSQLRAPGGSGILSLAFSPDGRVLVSAGADGRVRLWDVAIGCVAETLAAHSGQVLDVTFSRDGRLVASAGTDDRVRIWRVR